MKVNFNRIIIPSSRDSILNLFTKFIQCKICMNLLNDPYDCLCCNQTFCKSCIINYIKTNNKCPFSEFFDINKQKEKNQYIKSNIHDLFSKIKPSSSNFAKIIQSLKFYCQNNDKGCNFELNIEEISEHEKICKYKEKKIKVELNNKNKNISNTIFRNKKDKDKNINKESNIFDEKYNSFDSNNDLLQYNRNNEIRHQDSVVSFSGIKNLSENKDINQFYLNENSLNNIFNNNSKIEKSIEEINQKLSCINNFIINNYDLKYFNDIKINSNSKKNIDNNFPDIYKENNETELNKVIKRNSTTITNNFYNDSYINTVNNLTTDNLDLSNKNNCFNAINSKINTKEKKIKLFKEKKNNNDNYKEDNKKKDKKNNKLCNSLKSRKNTSRILTNSKKNIKNKIEKKNGLNEEKINKEKEKENNNTENKINDQLILKNQIINDISNATPKLGEKAQSRIEGIKPFDLKLNLNFENNNKNNTICGKTSGYSNINEDIFNGIKNLSCKITDIERLLQSNNSFKSQTYSIQTDDLFGNIQNDDSITNGAISIKSSIKEIHNIKKCKNTYINKEQNENNINNEGNNDNRENNNNCFNENRNEENEKIKNDNFLKNIEKLIENIEQNIKNLLENKFDDFKKIIEEQVMEDIKKSVLDTNFDIMTLCTDKLNEYEKMLNEKIINLKL